MSVINYENFRSFGYSNDKLIKGEIKGIVIEFPGINNVQVREDNLKSVRYAEKGILIIGPYNNPWCWMNQQAVEYTDMLVDVMFEKYNLPESTPIVSVGHSMGGLGTLIYTRYSKRTPKVCIANCPVTDLPYHYNERPDLPRVILSAFWHERDDLQKAMERRSPLHIVSEMPKIEYHLFHSEWDSVVLKEISSDKLYAAMKDDFNITYTVSPKKPHCAFSPEAAKEFEQYIFDAIK